MPNWTSDNQLSVKIDGQQVYSSLLADLQAVDNLGFIYLAFWQFSPDLVLDVNRPACTLGTVLRQKALSGVPVCILMWDYFTTLIRRITSAAAGVTTLGSVITARTNPLAPFYPLLVTLGGQTLANRITPTVEPTMRWAEAVNRQVSRTRRGIAIQLHVADFPDPGMSSPDACRLGPGILGISLGSHHQKVAILNIRGEPGQRRLVSYVLGLNATNEYQDDSNHRRDYPAGGPSIRPRPWHDAGVRAVGAVAAQVEGEFIRRWNLHCPDIPLSPACCQEVPTGSTSARLLRTTTQDQEIRHELESCFSQATRSVYIEDQYFFNREIIDCLIDALLAAERRCRWDPGQYPLQIALLTNGPEEFQVYGSSVPLELFRYVNFKNLQLATCQSVRVRSPARQINRTPGEVWRLFVEYGGSRWNPRSLYFFDHDGNQVFLRDILSVQGGIRPAYIWSVDAQCSIYVHSKISIIDDEVLFIGSPNYSKRSFEYDSEASLQIEDRDMARAVRLRLFEEILGAPPPSTPFTSVEDQFAFWHEIAHRNASAGVRGQSGADRNVFLVEYPDNMPDFERIARIVSRAILTGGTITTPWPLRTLVQRLLREQNQRGVEAMLGLLLEEVYRFC